MKIYFVRHGETQENIDRIISGHSSVKLTENGKKQAAEIIPEIPKTCSIIYASDLIRCKQTTEIINQELKLPVIYDTRLREIDTGSLTGKFSKDIDQQVRRDIKTAEYNTTPFGGESSEDVKKRILSFMKEVREKHPGEEILVVTSAGIIRMVHFLLNNVVHEVIHSSSVHEFEF